MKAMHDDRVHARMAVVRDLFGITVQEGVPAAADVLGEPEGDDLAEVRELPARAAARGTFPQR
jgi:hypothetical protein